MKFLPAATSILASSLLITTNINSSTAFFVTPHGGNTIFFQPSSSSATPRFISSARFSAVAPQDAQQQEEEEEQSSSPQNNNDDDEFGGVLTGEVLSILRPDSNNGGGAAFAVVKVCEEDLLPNSAYAVAKAMATADAAAKKNEKEEHVTTTEEEEEEDEEEKVELASALFGKPMPQAVKESTAAAAAKNGGAVADGDFTGRTVSFLTSNQKGIIIAHRHPIVFVLLENNTPTISDNELELQEEVQDGNTCSISHKLVSIDPSAILPGSIVDYLGNSLAVLNDGSVGRSLPKAATPSTRAAAVDLESGMGIGGIATDGISLTVSTSLDDDNDSSSATTTTNTRPIFMPIPKISEIGLIDSPLVSGITAIDALTPIGRGQNMLVVGNADDTTDEATTSNVGRTTNKRGWMINFLRNVIENNRNDDESKKMRCFYGLTSGDGSVRSNLLDKLKEAGIQEDVVTVLSTSNHDEEKLVGGTASSSVTTIPTDKAMAAAEAVAVAASTCSLAEHHALTTGGDSIVFIDDLNLHKSLWDVTTQFLVQVYGEDAVVAADLQGSGSSEMRGYFSGLIQRSARFNLAKGGGSVTLILLSTLPGDEDQVDGNNGDEEEPTFDPSDFENMPEKIKARISMLVKAKVPLTPTNLKKIQIPLPSTSDAENAKRLALQHVEDLISMSDGQIWLDDALAKSGRSPPLDPSRSITRVGVGADTVSCRADAPALRSVVGSLRFEFQQAMDVMDTATTSSIVGNKKQVQRRDAFLLAMHQESNQRRKLSHECIALLAASRGHLDAVLAEGGLAGTDQGREAIDGLIEYVESNASGAVTEIESSLDLSNEGKSLLEDAIASYFS
eukprot:CAMPEP_0201722754 /NCGR_PEP_ID=MMETSP0593-20130828/7005_1 /ASSEMBLY_ACC=CAM_ASM_000672 /TAXON_ID=267983 /ORGANISM="Skeletonema japonicum, Strain CCMP2506" /LENGTH=844 /DNA_ID=CAMNT_0048213739 /DNA_START=213 /DNA_END=2744 /DNA_ORIENTATION=+